MWRVEKVKFFDALSPIALESDINSYIKANPGENITDIKFNVYLEELDPSLVEDGEDPKPNRFSAFLLISAEI